MTGRAEERREANGDGREEKRREEKRREGVLSAHAKHTPLREKEREKTTDEQPRFLCSAVKQHECDAMMMMMMTKSVVPSNPAFSERHTGHAPSYKYLYSHASGSGCGFLASSSSSFFFSAPSSLLFLSAVDRRRLRKRGFLNVVVFAA